MAKRKIKLHRVIHPNRYLIWTIAIAFIIAAALVSYIYIGNINEDVQQTRINPNPEFWHTYKGTDLTFRYPAEWLIDPGTGYVGFGLKNEDSFLVYSYSSNDAAYESYQKSPNIKEIVVDGKIGIRIIDTTNNNQHIAFVKNGSKLYEFRGDTLLFDQILKTVHFLK